ncbi:hypothetical protein N9043_00725 [bacterium]|nr:hypothetical protein [bacterium]
MNMQLNCDNTCDQDVTIDDRFFPKNGDVSNIHRACVEDCRPPPCDDIQEGMYEFSGPKTIRSLCDVALKCGVLDDGTFERHSPFKHSYPIYRVSSEEGCDKIVGAIWRDSDHEYTIKCAGDYYIKYTWDNCFETEPKFEEIDVCCDPCA